MFKKKLVGVKKVLRIRITALRGNVLDLQFSCFHHAGGVGHDIPQIVLSYRHPGEFTEERRELPAAR